MKNAYLLLISLCMLVLTACGATEASEEDIYNNQVAQDLIKDNSFMVKARRLVIKQHSFPAANPSTNFLVVDGDNAIVQVSPASTGGPNGVGGFTVKGSVTGYKVTNHDNGDMTVSYHVQSIGGSCDVLIKLLKDSNDAVVTITSTFRGYSATIYGNLLSIDNSIYTGISR